MDKIDFGNISKDEFYKTIFESTEKSKSLLTKLSTKIISKSRSSQQEKQEVGQQALSDFYTDSFPLYATNDPFEYKVFAIGLHNQILMTNLAALILKDVCKKGKGDFNFKKNKFFQDVEKEYNKAIAKISGKNNPSNRETIN